MFENAYYIIAPGENVPEEKTAEFKETVTKIGAIPVIISPYEHDYAVASISHVPHIIAAALVNNVKKLDSDKEYMHLLAAGGFKDITRIASSSADMWESITFENKEDIISVLDSFSEDINDIRSNIMNDNTDYVYNYFLNAQQYRNTFNTTTPKAVSYTHLIAWLVRTMLLLYIKVFNYSSQLFHTFLTSSSSSSISRSLFIFLISSSLLRTVYV